MTLPFENLAPADRIALAVEANKNARQALQLGNIRTARRFAENSVKLAPELEDGWLLMAATASPHASIIFLQKALKINPGSQRAQKGMQWAIERLQVEKSGRKTTWVAPPAQAAAPILPTSPEPAAQKEALLTPVTGVIPAPPTVQARKRTAVQIRPTAHRKPRQSIPFLFLYGLVTICISSAFLAASLTPYYSQISLPFMQSFLPYAPVDIQATFVQPTPTYPAIELSPEIHLSATPIIEATQAVAEYPTATPTETASPTPAPTDTPVPTPTETLAPTATFTASPTPLPPTLAPPPTQAPPPPTAAVQPTKKVKKKYTAAPDPRPPGVQLADHWVDVDLSAQTVFAMQGDQVVRSFVVSTGRWPTITVTGIFRIYVKYRAADMSGDDYYLPDVPYVMYFYEGYGLHGTYWHNNFGTPMSHGCVNLRTDDAAWLYEYSSVGTIVSVHQ